MIGGERQDRDGAPRFANASLPLWRSLLYVPVNVAKFVERAPLTGADAIQLDLEDSIAASEKESARSLVQDAAKGIADSGIDVVVRINRPLSLAVRDIECSICPSVRALSLPKVESADQVRLLSEVMAEAELRAGMAVGATRLIIGIETPSAWFKMPEIASAHARNAAMLLGSEDFATEVGMSSRGDNLLAPKQALVLAAAAAGILPLGIVGSFANFRDIDGFRAMVKRSRALGFRGSSCIHPDQVDILNEAFAPESSEVDAARRIVDSYEAAIGDNRGAVALDGAMIDLPVVERAKRLLEIHARVRAREDSRTR